MMIANAIVNDTAADDDVFKRPSTPPLKNDNNLLTSSSSIESSGSSNTVTEQQSPLSPNNALCRSRRSHFSRKDSTPDKSKSEGELNLININTKNSFSFHLNLVPDVLQQQRICYTVQSLWWFCKNLPLCKCTPDNIDKIREACPFILREKVCDFINDNRNNNSNSNNNENVMGLSNVINNTNVPRGNNNNKFAGSGRLFFNKKMMQPISTSLDECPPKSKNWRDNNNNNGSDKALMRRTSSTNCLQEASSRTNILGDRAYKVSRES